MWGTNTSEAEAAVELQSDFFKATWFHSTPDGLVLLAIGIVVHPVALSNLGSFQQVDFARLTEDLRLGLWTAMTDIWMTMGNIFLWIRVPM